MFKGLRNTFLFLHMGVVALIFFFFFATGLFLNYQNMHYNTDMMLDRAFGPYLDGAPMPPPGDMRDKLSPIFTVELDENQDVKEILSMFALEDAFYYEITEKALSKGSDRGVMSYGDSHFKFKMNSERIVFLDISKEMQMFTNNIYTFLWITLPLLFIIFLFSLYFANRAIKPIEASYNKQKEFIADASHEIKTPLAVISTNVDMLLGEANSQQKKWLSYIKAETERMSNLTGSLLYLTKLDYTAEKDAVHSFNFSNMIEDCLMPLEAVFYENRIQTQISILPDVKVKGDSGQIRRLIGILIDNGIKYASHHMEILLERVGTDVKLTVFNTGKGIPADELPKIWDRFYRGDKSRENTGGFGLGLPIAKVIAEKHKGSITAESAENQWARFILKLPLEK